MTGVRMVDVAADDDGVRLDRWFKKHYPGVSHGRLEKMLRKGQVRVDKGRAKASTRLAEGQTVRVPPLDTADAVRKPPKRQAVSDKDAAMLRSRVLYRDDHVLIIDKPAGLAVQGGSGTHRHLDGMLDALTFDAMERPRLVHRLDKDTSGTLVLARTARAARDLTQAFKSKTTRKIYWALVAGVPQPPGGRIDMALAKLPGQRGERMVADPAQGQRAISMFDTVEKIGKQVSWLVMEPLTGRTHQLRVHCADVLETPILGDGKYGGQEAYLDGMAVSKKLHLHARAVRVPSPAGGMAEAVADLPEHMKASWAELGFDLAAAPDPFADWGA